LEGDLSWVLEIFGEADGFEKTKAKIDANRDDGNEEVDGDQTQEEIDTGTQDDTQVEGEKE
jgi:hypothetical protein